MSITPAPVTVVVAVLLPLEPIQWAKLLVLSQGMTRVHVFRVTQDHNWDVRDYVFSIGELQINEHTL